MQGLAKDFREKKWWFISSAVSVITVPSPLTSATAVIVSKAQTPRSLSYFSLKCTPVSISLIIPLTGPPIVCWNSFPLHPWVRSSARVPPHPAPSFPASSTLWCCFSFKWTVGFFFILYKCWIRLIALIPLGVANWFYPRMYHFSCFLFFSCKEKEPLRQQASPEWKIKNLDITYLAALLPTGLCKTQLNVSPLNTALQHIKQEILQAWWQSSKPCLQAVPRSFLSHVSLDGTSLPLTQL